MSKNILAGRVRKDRRFVEVTYPPAKIETKIKVVDGKRIKVKVKVPQDPIYKDVVCPVWVPSQSCAPKSAVAVEWPDFKNERERIRHNSTVNAELTISEAFAKAYGLDIKVNPTIKAQIDNAPKEMKVGDILEVFIKHIDKHHVEFDSLNLKQQISSSVNLSRFENFKHFLPVEPVKVKVVVSTHEKVVVDPLTPMLEEWLNPIIEDPNIQKLIDNPQTILVKDLKLTRGGFVGRAVIPNISKFVGEPYTIEAFIPGSQIVLNIEDDFNKWIGKSVYAFVTSYIPKPNSINQMSLICSVKEYLKFLGERNLISLFGKWCDDGAEWKRLSREVLQGRVTGIINSAKKCGVFVEVPALNITGMVNVKADELVNYKPGDKVGVCLTNFEENVYYDDAWKQLRHDAPYVVENGVLTKCNLKPVLEFVTNATGA